MWKEAAGGMGIATNDPYILTVKDNINTGIKLFKSAAQQYITRKEVTADLEHGQQFYTYAPDVIRTRNVRVNNGSLIFPIPMVESENEWNMLNVIPQFAVFYPQRAFVRGSNEVGVWPIPSADLPGGLIIAYDGRLEDMYLDDTLGLAVTVTNGSNIITCPGGFLPSMIGMKLGFSDGSDGNWYSIVGYTNGTTMSIDNLYGKTSQTSSATIIGTVPDFPEEYHPAPIYYALEQYYLLKRINVAAAANFNGKFLELQEGYLGTFSDKETSQIINPRRNLLSYNPLLVPPISMDQ